MKKIIVLIAAILVLTLSGCADIPKYIEKELIQKSGVLEEEDYKEYQQFIEKNELDNKGYIRIDEIENEEPGQESEQGQVHVTFADNRYLIIDYYKDAALTKPIVGSSCYLNPGDCIYVATAESKNPYSNDYRLQEFRIYEYDAEGNRKILSIDKSLEDGKICEIPIGYEGTEISIFPVGEYQKRILLLNDYDVTDEGELHNLTGVGIWKVNGEEYGENRAEINFLGRYTVTYTYDAENYFYVSSEPECFNHNSENGVGVVEFRETGTTEEARNYSVELHRYLTVSIQLSEQGTISLNGGPAEVIKKNKVWTGKLQYGDKIVIETNGTYKVGDCQHIQESVALLANGVSRYTLEITPEQVSNMDSKKVCTVTLDTNAKYGKCVYILEKEEVSGRVEVEEGQKITLKYTITDEDYEFEQGESGIAGFFKGIFKSEEQTAEISVTVDLDGKTIFPDEQFTFRKRVK